jgi:hypothetical protein
MWKELLKNFTATEVTLPYELDKLVEADVNLKYLKSAINEDLWVQVVKYHQYNPGFYEEIDNEYSNIMNLLKEDYDTLLHDVHKQEDIRDYLVRTMLFQTSNNLKRIAQSFARADEKDKIERHHLKNARNMIIDNFTGFINHPKLHNIKSIMEIKKENARFSIVQTEIINNPLSSTRDIYSAIKSSKFFYDIYDLQNFLDWLQIRGFIIRSFKGEYQWVGR